MKQLRTGLSMLVILTVITGVIYPLVVTAAAQVLFPQQANGSLITEGDAVIGSELVGQMTYALDANGEIVNLDAIDRYFWGRPSAVNYMLGSSPASLGSSGATNYGSTNVALAEQVTAREAAFRAANGVPQDTAVPTEMLYASGSGLDPHISPEAARLQIDRVAAARGLSQESVARLVEQFVEPPQFGLLGQSRVNMLLLNLALDQLE